MLYFSLLCNPHTLREHIEIIALWLFETMGGLTNINKFFKSMC